MIYVISKSTFGSYNVRDIQCNANWDCCPYSDYALIPDSLVEGILDTQGYCDITLNGSGTEVVSFVARAIPPAPKECRAVIGAATYPKAVSGEVITAYDSIAAPLPSLTLYGKTTQDGTPTPETPVELVSAGNGGSIGVNVTGKNLFGGDALADKLVDMISATKDEAEGTVTFTADKVGTKKFLQNSFKPNTRYTFILYGRNSRKDSSVVNIDVDYTNGDRDRLSFSTIGEDSYAVFTSDADKTVRSLRGFNYGGTVTLHYDKCGVFEGVLTEADFVPYVGQTLTASTPNGLPGIPVASGDNYTDENGQMWICDEIDFARGVYVRPVLYEVFDGSDDENWTDRTGSRANTFSISLSRKFKSMYQVPAISNYGYGGTVDGVASAKSGVTLYYKSGNTSPSALMYFKDSACATVDELRAKLSTTPLVVAVVANEPIETPLSAEELAQYAALHTYKPETTVYNDAGAYMDVEYYVTNAAVPIEAGAANEGKFLRVVNGAAAWVTVNSAEGGSF
jgi:hypothetical protein